LKSSSIGREIQDRHFSGRQYRRALYLAVPLIITIGFSIWAQPARSAEVWFNGYSANYRAVPGENNNVTIRTVDVTGLNLFTSTHEAFRITDSEAIINLDANRLDSTGNPLEGCVTFGSNAYCPASEGTYLFISAGDGNDHVDVANSGDDPTQFAKPRSVYVCGGDGNDTLIGGDGSDRLVGGPGADVIIGNDGQDLIAGNSGDFLQCFGDTSDSQPGDRLDGGDGSDLLVGSSGQDTLLGGGGGDYLYGREGDDSLDGGSGNDALVGESGNDSLYGGDGTDELTGGSGSDSESGGDGNDEIGTSWTFAPGVVERDDGDDTMDGGAGNDVLNGGPGQNMVTAFDTSLRNVDEGPEVAGSNGNDSMHGGEGDDTVTYVKRAGPVTLSLDGAKNDGAPGERDRIASDVETVVGGSGDDVIIGSASNDELDGGKGSDSIEGGPGDDHLSGGRGDEGRDRIAGGEGNDTITGLNGGDLLHGGPGNDSVAGGGGADALDGGNGDDTMMGGPGGDLVMGGAGNDNVNGSDPLLPGADGADDLRGGPGKDSLEGGEGDDLLSGGPGPDVLHGGSGVDTADYSMAAGPVTISLDGKANDGEDGEHDNFGTDVEAGLGGGEQDLLSGDARDNVLSGGGGEDFIVGGQGSDRLNGNDGNDAIQSRDSIRDLVNCGRGFDVAIVDDKDLVRDNCELVDRKGGRSTALGRLVSVRLVRGTVRMRPRSMDRLFPLTGEVELPLRSSVDAHHGTVELSANAARGHTGSSVLRGGAFMVDQKQSRSPLTHIRLRGGGLERCGAHDRGSAMKSRGLNRTLWVRARGRLRVVGLHGFAQGQNATWTTSDRCDGTLVRVQHGKVKFFDRIRKKSFRLTAGEARLARS
jgi:Ca2+-binding RTX toxin-like protein